MLDEDQNAAPDSIFYSVEFEAMKNGGHVDKILQFPFNNGRGIDDPTTATKVYWEKSDEPSRYAKGQCSVHITHYQIPKDDTKYYLEAHIKDAHGIEIGHVDKTDATEPVNVYSALPLVLVITAAKRGSSKTPDDAPLQFAYGGDKWSSKDNRCKFGGYEDGDREGDCRFACQKLRVNPLLLMLGPQGYATGSAVDVCSLCAARDLTVFGDHRRHCCNVVSYSVGI